MTVCKIDNNQSKPQCVSPCPVFGQCGGCSYHHIPYSEELKIKEEALEQLFFKALNLDHEIFESIIPSPKIYNYRHRLDLKFLRTKEGNFLMGFSPLGRNEIVPVSSCPIALEAVSNFLPQLKKEAVENCPPRYRNANLVVKTSDNGRVLWGGIGRRSLQRIEVDYLWTVVNGKKIFYSLDTFFQANLSILPKLIDKITSLNMLDRDSVLFDCYGGVGLLGISLADQVKKVTLIEECPASIKLANYNSQYHYLSNFQIIPAKVEERLASEIEKHQQKKKIVILDPPRKGLSPEVINVLIEKSILISGIIYLSCHPESLVSNLKELQKNCWQVNKIIPFDFFPRTSHVETLVVLNAKNR